MLANIIYSQFGRVNDWPMGAALAISMLLTVALVALVGMWISRKVREHFA
jgi:spermidine/putrescine transport system permease protein